MNSERLLQHFDMISEAPDAVARLRRLILDLAVRGKLVEQEADGCVGSVFVDRRKSAPTRSRAARAERNGEDRDGFDFALPQSWRSARLTDLVDCLDFMRRPINGAERAVRIEGKAEGELFPYYGSTQQQGLIDDFIFDEALLLLGEDGVPFFDPLRRKAYLIEGKTWVNNHAHVFRVIHGSRQFLAHWLNVFDYSGRVVGATRSKLNQARALDIPVPVPPASEQHRIVAKVDELMGLCDQLQAARDAREQQRDRLVAASLHRMTANHDGEDELTKISLRHLKSVHFHLDHLPRLSARHEHIRQLRQTILDLAVHGKLTSREAKDGASESLMRSLRGAKTAAIESGSVRARAAIDLLSLDHVRNQMPTQWGFVVFDEVLVITGGVAKGRKLSGRSLTSVPYLRVANVQRGRLDLGLIKEIEVPNEEIERYRLSEGDVLLTEGGDWDKLGRAAIWRSEIALCLHQNHVFRVRSLRPELLLPEWIEMFANGPIGISYFQSAAKQTTNLASINMTQLRGCPLPIPTPAEQRRIVVKVEQLMAICDQLEASLVLTQTDRARLLDSLLHEALAPERAPESDPAMRTAA